MLSFINWLRDVLTLKNINSGKLLRNLQNLKEII